MVITSFPHTAKVIGTVVVSFGTPSGHRGAGEENLPKSVFPGAVIDTVAVVGGKLQLEVNGTPVGKPFDKNAGQVELVAPDDIHEADGKLAVPTDPSETP